VKQVSIGSAQKFQPRQIVCLEHERTCLYAEIIEFVELRQVCWVRPFMLAVLEVGSEEPANLCDLRLGADLLWPASLFRPALDTEVIPLLVQLNVLDTPAVICSDAHQQLCRFVREVWQAYKSAF
jgi:hypothetical protein